MNDVRLKDYIEPLAQREGYIFDLRGFSSISEYFLSFLTNDSILNAKWEVPVYTQPDKLNPSSSIFGTGKISGNGKLSGKKVVFITDEKTTGYAEAIISIIKSNKLAKVLGQPTSGAPGEVFAVRLYGNFNVSLSGLKVYSPDGNLLTGSPIKPDILVEYELPEKDMLFDKFIQESLKLIKN
jgi:C-terminal processing protease CtpA/Prc